jgi:N-methylhydantoinase B
MTNTRNTPIEALEASYPVRVLALGVRRRSGGKGRHRGGDGVHKVLRFLAPARVAFVGERHVHGPWGLGGGSPGRPGRLFVRRSARRAWERKGGRFAAELAAGAELRIETPGGGGFGRARRRRATP